MDAPHLLKKEWAHQDILRKLDVHYDDIWVYGPKDFWDPLTGLDVSPNLRARLLFTGFLRREVKDEPLDGDIPDNMLVVTAGGGGDGARLMAQVLAAYEHDPQLTHPMVMVLGPFMSAEERKELSTRAAANPHVRIVHFETHLLALMRRASAVVSMAGYNTFCEILSLDQRALFVPRYLPREEQLIRATRAAELGLGAMLHPDASDDPKLMAQALRDLPMRARPSQASQQVDMEGLERICDRIASHFAERSRHDVIPFSQRRDKA